MADLPLEGTYRRQIDLRAWDGRTVVGWLEDESHHFGLTLEHDGVRIVDVRIAAVRIPWTTCAGAGEPLRGLVGQPLMERCAAIGTLIAMDRQCTHLFDLAGLAMAHAHAGRQHRRYHGTVRPLADLLPGAPADWQRATLRRDGQPVLCWDLHDNRIMGPPPFAGRSILHGFRPWSEGLATEDAEAALVLRRVAYVAQGRRISIEHARVADDMGQAPVCHSFQPEFRQVAFRVGDTQRRFDENPDGMLTRIASQP